MNPDSSALRSASVPDGLPQPQRWHAMLVIVLGLTLAVLDSSVLTLALPGIARELGVSPAQSIWVVNAYQICILVMLLPLAALGDKLGYRRIYLGGMALFGVASLAAMMAGSLWTLVFARALQGLGAAGIMSVNAALVRLIYPRAKLGTGMAINSMVVAVSSVAGPTVAAAVLSVATWPWLFAINVPLGLVTWWVGRRALPFNLPRAEPVKGQRQGFTLFDFVLNALMFGCIFVGADHLGVRGGDAPPALWPGLSLLAFGVLVGVFYLRRQASLIAPMFPVDLLRLPVFALSMASSVSAFCAQTLAYVCLPFLLLETHGRSPWAAGMLITAWPAAIVLVAPLAGRLIGRYPDGLLGGIGMALFALGLWLLAALPALPSDLDIVWRMMVCGAGFALFQSPNNHTIVTSAPLHRSGAASGMLGTARLTGQTSGAILLAVLFSLWPEHDGFSGTLALVIAGVFACVAGVCSSLRVRTAGGVAAARH